MENEKPKQESQLMKLLARYKLPLFILFVIGVVMNAGSLIIPRLMSNGINDFAHGTLDNSQFALQLGGVAVVILVLTYIQSILQVYTGEKVARYLRDAIVAKITKLDYLKIQEFTAAKLLTNLTSDVDNVKMFIAQAFSILVSSLVLLIGTAVLLLTINWQLALAVLTIVPIIAVAFFVIFGKARNLFQKFQTNIDGLNRVINESVIGAAVVRVLNSQKTEEVKFQERSGEARDLGFSILSLFAALIPIVTFVASMATVIILYVGGNLIINGNLNLGDFISFNSYVSLLVFPIFMIGFTSQMISRADSSLQRIYEVLNAEEMALSGGLQAEIDGKLELEHIILKYGEKQVLKDVSFTITAHKRTAIIGPTAAGKTQLMNLLAGLLLPSEGKITVDDNLLSDYDQVYLHRQIGLVFQDSMLFNTTIRENIAFNNEVNDADLQKAIDTAELKDFIAQLPEGLNTLVTERGTSLSGGQKQRVMLARALTLNPKILLLDDFTARVDAVTQARILSNIKHNYPGITIVAITQKIASVEDYEQIVLLMEGELVAKGTHAELLNTSPEYAQIYQSQQSTNEYELQIN